MIRWTRGSRARHICLRNSDIKTDQERSPSELLSPPSRDFAREDDARAEALHARRGTREMGHPLASGAHVPVSRSPSPCVDHAVKGKQSAGLPWAGVRRFPQAPLPRACKGMLPPMHKVAV